MVFDSRLVLFLTVSTLLVGSVHLYLYRRLVRDTLRRKLWLRLGMVAMTLLAVGMLSARLASMVLPRSLLTPFVTGAWLWMGLAIYLFLFFLLTDAFWVGRRLVGRFRRAVPTPVDESRRLFVARAVAGSAAALSGGTVSFGYWRAFHPPVVKELSLRLRGLPKALEGFSLVLLSDIHVGGVIEQKFMAELVGRVNALSPDLVAVTGDLVDGDVPTLGPAVAELRKLQAPHGAWFVTGNHEYYSGDVEWADALPGLGLQVLRNRRVVVGDAGASFDLVGVDDWRGRGKSRYDLAQATFGRDPERPAVLLAHQPLGFRDAVARGIGLQLSGHTHGGQFFPGTLVVPLVYEHSAGHYTHREGHLYVSRGTGFWGPPLRVGSPPEIVKLSLLA
ncbi:MAG: metallophosphoesterase [Myxococcota bacterium]